MWRDYLFLSGRKLQVNKRNGSLPLGITRGLSRRESCVFRGPTGVAYSKDREDTRHRTGRNIFLGPPRPKINARFSRGWTGTRTKKNTCQRKLSDSSAVERGQKNTKEWYSKRILFLFIEGKKMWLSRGGTKEWNLIRFWRRYRILFRHKHWLLDADGGRRGGRLLWGIAQKVYPGQRPISRTWGKYLSREGREQWVIP